MNVKKPTKKPLPSAAEFALNGAGHREQEHQPRAKKAQPEKAEKPVTVTVMGGRPKTFEGETERVPVILPAELALKLRIEAVKRKQSPSQIVAALLEKAL
jgi:hypothetical protein